MQISDELVAQTELYRSSIISYIYRLTGCLEEAKDITQDTILKYLTLENNNIKNPKAWMFKVATNLCLDFFKSSRNKKETYIGQWLPEPFVQDIPSVDIEVQRDESLSIALLLLMEKLNYKEKIAYILHDVFDFTHKEISLILDTSVANCRQICSRANKKLNSKSKQNEVNLKEHKALSKAFLDALKYGKVQNLTSLFSQEVKFYTDGGGKARSVKKVIKSSKYVAKFLRSQVISFIASNEEDIELKVEYFNCEFGVLLFHKNILITAFNLEIKNNIITNIYTHRNPDKLKFFIS